MPATIDDRRAKDRSASRLADLAEDAAFIVMLFSGLVLVVALIAALVI
jgi:hypothetical protein